MRSLNQIYFIFWISIIIFLPACFRNKETPKNTFSSADTLVYAFKALFKGNFNNLFDSLDKKSYFIVETQLTNNSDKTLEFVTTSCSTVTNIVTDSKQIDFLLPWCAGHYHILIKLKPKQVYSMSFIVYTKLDVDLKVKFGFVLITPQMYQESHFLPHYEINTNRNKTIWSNPITLEKFSTHNFKILQMINDTTYSYIESYNFEKLVD